MSKNRYKKSRLKLLYRSFDTRLSGKEQSKLENALADNEEISKEAKTLDKMRHIIAESGGSAFDPFFADRVLVRLREEDEDFIKALFWSFKRIVIVGAATIVLLMVNNFITGGEFSLDSALGLPQLTLEETLSLNQFFEGK
jgi:hypothetical protein